MSVAILPGKSRAACLSMPRPYATCPAPARTTRIAFSSASAFFIAATAFCAIVASHVHCASNIPFQSASLMPVWIPRRRTRP